MSLCTWQSYGTDAIGRRDTLRDRQRSSTPVDELGDIPDGAKIVEFDVVEVNAKAEPFFKAGFAPLHASDATGESEPLSAALNKMLTSPQVRARTDDDASLILATRRARPA